VTARACRPAGVTLLEALITLALVGLFLVVVSDLTSGLGRAQRLSDDRGKTLQALATVCGRISEDLRAASSVVEPESTSSSQLVVRRLAAPGLSSPSARLPFPVPVPTYYVGWNPLDESYLETVTYRVDADLLTRGAGSDPAEALGPASSLLASVRSQHLYEVVLTLHEHTSEQRLKTVVFRW
jgi:type II secretory pathway component PulJ